MRHILYFVLVVLVCSCTTYSDDLEGVLRQAGKNRGELEKVLKYYGENKADSLKYRAAEFLIVNMPGKYSMYYDAPWNDAATVFLRWTSSSNKQLVLDEYGLGKKIGKYDLLHITGDYLINNIELAFQVWQEMPWGKNISFDVFCEEILPYRISTELLENWRKKVLVGFEDLYNEFRDDTTGITPVEACFRVNDVLPDFRLDKDFPPINYTQLMASTRGLCFNMSALAIFVMRGLGIPVTYEFSLLQFGYDTGHSWNSVNDGFGTYHPFMGTGSNPGFPLVGPDICKGKVYRRVYADQKQVWLDKSDIPPLLGNINYMVDVTSHYESCMDISIPVLNRNFNLTKNVFLAVFHRKQWHPIGWGVVTGDSMRFQSVKSGLYMPAYFHNGVQASASYPFYLSDDGNLRLLQPDTVQSLSKISIDENSVLTGTNMDKKLNDMNPDNGHIFELFYWDGNKWLSLGQKKAENHFLQFKIPDNALFMLEDIMKKENNLKLFCVVDGKQKWIRND